jgi:hypothetical protein
MTLKQKLIMGTGAVALALVGITGALASGHDGAGCTKSECGKVCPKDSGCPGCPACPGR